MANISSYNQLSSWNEDDDLLFVQQPDAPKKAHPSQMKEYILGGLDVSSVGGTGKYISAISEADGKINATAETMDTAPTEGSTKAATSGGIKTAIDDSVSLKTATGNPITLTDAANTNAEELLMTIEPVQSGSGDPSPTNVRPISGLTEGKVFNYGENLVDITGLTSSRQEQGITFTLNGDGSVTANGTAAGRCQIYWVIPNNIATQLAGKTLSGNPSINNCSLILELDGSPFTTYATDTGEGGVISNDIASAPEAQGVSLIWRIQAGVSLDNVTITPRISDANTATITLGQTVYGGSVNFKTGEVTVTHGMVDLGSLTWIHESANTRFAATLSDMAYAESTTALPDFKCSQYAPVSIVDFNNGADKAIRGNDAGAKDIRIRDTAYTDAAAFKTAMSGVQLCYELATPTTLTLTPAELELLKGNNTITANGAEINIEYYPDNAIGVLAGRVDALNGKTDTLEDSIDTLGSGKVDRFVSSSNGATQTIDIGTKNTNRMYLLSVGYSTQYGDHYVFGLILINDSSRIKYVSLVDGTTITVSATYTNGIVTLTFSESPYSNAVLIRLS